MAYVDLEEVGEDVGFVMEGGEGSRHQGRGAVHQKHGAGHEVGEAVKPGVGAFVEGEVFDTDGVGQFEGLTEAEGQTFASDGVDGAGGVADEGDVAGCDAAEATAHGDGSPRSIA